MSKKTQEVIIKLSIEEHSTLVQDINMLTSQKYLFDDDGRLKLLLDIKRILLNKKKTKKL